MPTLLSPHLLSCACSPNHLDQRSSLQPEFKPSSIWFQSKRGDTKTRKWVTKHGPCWPPYYLCPNRLYCSANIRSPILFQDAGSGHRHRFGWWNLSGHDQVECSHATAQLCSVLEILSSTTRKNKLVPGGRWSTIRKHMEGTWTQHSVHVSTML